MYMKTVVQIVQHLCPGGIEVMALELKKTLPKDTQVILVSLEGQFEDTVSAWPLSLAWQTYSAKWVPLPYTLTTLALLFTVV